MSTLTSRGTAIHRALLPAGPRACAGAIAFVALGTVAYAILVGFAIVSLWSSQQAAADTVADEASSLDHLLTLTQAMAPADATAIRDAMREYATVEVDLEWDRMRAGDAGLIAGPQLDAIFTAIVRADGSTPVRASAQDKAIDDFKDLEDHRRMDLSYPFSGQLAVSQRPFSAVVREIDQQAGR
jgi:hypothetical protein